MKDAKGLRGSLQALGLSGSAIDAAWPEWWSDAAEASTSAQTELRFSISRKLGLDPKSLLVDEPRFVWKDQAKFKRLTSETENERAALTSFGTSVARALLSATPEQENPLEKEPATYRELILRHRPYVGLDDLISLCWAIGIPLIHLRVHPLASKKMTAMIVRLNGRFAILLAKDANYPAPIAFYVAHELGHAALQHIDESVAVVEFGDALTDRAAQDQEELEADRYALELLTGMPEPNFVPEGSGYNAPAIANAARQTAEELGVEPGTIALCFGHSTGAWPRVFSSLKMIYAESKPAWRAINEVAFRQLDWSSLNEDTAMFLTSVLGGNRDVERRIRQ